MTALKVLFFDIETAPLETFLWHPRQDYIPMEMIKEDTFIINWGAKWSGDRRIMSGLVTPDEALKRNDKRLIKELAQLIRQADVLVGHNINGFDLPKLNGRLMHYQLEPLGPVRTIDTLALSKRNFMLAYHKLDYLAQFLGIGNKIRTDFQLWRDCVDGSPKALKEMQRYNIQDVKLTEQVFEAMKPYVRNLPRLYRGVHGNSRICPFCGEDALIIRGYYDTQGSSFPRFQCKNCWRYSRAKSSDKTKALGVHPL